MTANEIFMSVMAVGVVLGGADKLLGCRLGIGQRFVDGLNCIAPMAMNMGGILVIAPALAQLLQPVVLPVFRAIGADPAMFGALFSIDMGGYSLSSALAEDPQLGLFSGLIAAALFGGIISYIIPVGMGLILPEEQEFFIKGVLLGLLGLPAGCFAGGLLMRLPAGILLRNLSPIILLSLFLLVGLLRFPRQLLRGFGIFNHGIAALAILGLMAGAVEYLTGIALLPGAQPILESFVIPGRIAVMLMGCLPLLELLFRLAHRLLDPLGRRLGVNGVTLEALLLITTTAIPAFSMLRDMPPKGKTAAIAWMCGAMGLVTSHYAFALGVDPSVCLPQAAAKLVVGGIGLGIALAIPSTSAFYHGTATGSLQKEH